MWLKTELFHITKTIQDFSFNFAVQDQAYHIPEEECIKIW